MVVGGTFREERTSEPPTKNWRTAPGWDSTSAAVVPSMGHGN